MASSRSRNSSGVARFSFVEVVLTGAMPAARAARRRNSPRHRPWCGAPSRLGRHSSTCPSADKANGRRRDAAPCRGARRGRHPTGRRRAGRSTRRFSRQRARQSRRALFKPEVAQNANRIDRKRLRAVVGATSEVPPEPQRARRQRSERRDAQSIGRDFQGLAATANTLHGAPSSDASVYFRTSLAREPLLTSRTASKPTLTACMIAAEQSRQATSPLTRSECK